MNDLTEPNVGPACKRNAQHKLPSATAETDADRFCPVCDYPLFLDFDLAPKPVVVVATPDPAPAPLIEQTVPTAEASAHPHGPLTQHPPSMNPLVLVAAALAILIIAIIVAIALLA